MITHRFNFVIFRYSAIIVVGDILSTPLPSKSGLYFENEGQIAISISTWKLVIYRDLEPLFIARDSLERLTSNYKIIVTNNKNLSSVSTSISYININTNKIDSRLKELQFYSTEKRVKREILHTFGTVLKWFIGTPDSGDAERYDKYIELFEKKQLENNHLLKQQLQIISSTITNFNETILKISYDEHLMNENLNRISSSLNSTSNALSLLQITQEINTIAIQILESITSLEQDINDILTSILFVQSGNIHPFIISTERIYKELLSSSHSRKHNNFVTPITFKNIRQLIDSASIKSYIYMNRLIYLIEFPLVKDSYFQTYHIYSILIPHSQSSLVSTLFPEQAYLAIDSNHQLYASFNSMEQCKEYAPNERVCNNMPIYNVNSRPICETAILIATSTEIPEQCEISNFAAHVNTFLPLKNNKWIYMLRHETPCILECGEKSTSHNLIGTGIVTLQENCKLYTSFVTLTASEETTRNVSHPIITVNIETDCHYKKPHYNKEPPELLVMKINNLQTDSLHSIREQIKIFSERLKAENTSFDGKNSSQITFWPAVIGITILSYIIYKVIPWTLFTIFRTISRGRHNENSYIQIFNYCFDNSSRRHRVEVPSVTINRNTSCISEDEDSADEESHLPQSSGTAQSLF